VSAFNSFGGDTDSRSSLIAQSMSAEMIYFCFAILVNWVAVISGLNSFLNIVE
jgi:hypothetical protein